MFNPFCPSTAPRSPPQIHLCHSPASGWMSLLLNWELSPGRLLGLDKESLSLLSSKQAHSFTPVYKNKAQFWSPKEPGSGSSFCCLTLLPLHWGHSCPSAMAAAGRRPLISNSPQPPTGELGDGCRDRKIRISGDRIWRRPQGQHALGAAHPKGAALIWGQHSTVGETWAPTAAPQTAGGVSLDRQPRSQLPCHRKCSASLLRHPSHNSSARLLPGRKIAPTIANPYLWAETDPDRVSNQQTRSSQTVTGHRKELRRWRAELWGDG